MWHKLTLNSNMDKRSVSRPSYSHLICYGRRSSYLANDFAVPDIIERGEMIWPKAIGMDATILGVSFLKWVAKANRIIDPFCGYGTVLAAANYMGLHAVGVDISPRRCRRALTRSVAHEIESIPVVRRKLLGMQEPMVYRPYDPNENISSKLLVHQEEGETEEVGSPDHEKTSQQCP
jgi:SAM-dependent methyltransferase